MDDLYIKLMQDTLILSKLQHKSITDYVKTKNNADKIYELKTKYNPMQSRMFLNECINDELEFNSPSAQYYIDKFSEIFGKILQIIKVIENKLRENEKRKNLIKNASDL